MNLKFWKKKMPTGTAEGGADDDRTVAIARDAESAEENTADAVRPGLLARLRNALSALRKPRDSGAESGAIEAGTPGGDEAAAAGRREEDEPVVVPLRNLKKRLIIGGALGAVILLLAGIGLSAWKLLAPNQVEQHKPPQAAAHDSTPATLKAPDSAAMQAQIEALKQQNAQMHSQLEALKTSGQRETPAAASVESAPAASSGDVVLFTGKDTKASAAALKQAIEAMNAASGGAKPHKPAQ